MNTAQWCEKALRATRSLWDESRARAFRNSHDVSSGDTTFRPTVTCNAIVAFHAYGLFSSPLFAFPAATQLDPSRLLKVFSRSRTSDWFCEFRKASSHKDGPRVAILVNHSLHALTSILTACEPPTADRSGIASGITSATESLVEATTGGASTTGSALANTFESDPRFSPFLLLYVRNSLLFRRALLSRAPMTRDRAIESRLGVIEQALERYFERAVDRIMARRDLQGDAGFDAASLVFALRGLTTFRSDSFRVAPFFAECIRAATRAQTSDGTWPDGVSAMIDGGADTLQQPSAKIALAIAECAFSPQMLVSFHPHEMSTLAEALPSLQRFAGFLAATYVAETGSAASGWTSDRVRWPSTSEAWITSLATRFFLILYLAETATARARTLEQFTVAWPPSRSLGERTTLWRSLIEPDQVCTPIAEVTRRTVSPILEQQRRGTTIVRPAKGGVSLLMFGPPGSGKTFFVKRLSSVLGWPLVQLTPGSFVSGGAELIESRAHAIFSMLETLTHAVVCFDECDELLRDRTAQDPGVRNILSFMTASMLPKLQELHDRQGLVFVVATNYLANIDPAIRRPGRFDYILLLDRPDLDARRTLIANVSRRRSGIVQHATQTAGLTISEIADFLDSGAEVPREGSRADYLEWCASQGKRELEASRLSPVQQSAILERWRALNAAG